MSDIIYKVGDPVYIVKHSEYKQAWFGTEGVVREDEVDGKYLLEISSPFVESGTELVRLSQDHFAPLKESEDSEEIYVTFANHSDYAESVEDQLIYAGSDKDYAFSFKCDNYYDSIIIQVFKGRKLTQTFTYSQSIVMRYPQSPDIPSL